MATVTDSPIPLQRLTPGQNAKITGLCGSSCEVARLAEMGLRQGAEISVLRGGSTCIVKLLGGCRLCVRPSAESSIMVKPT